ncbi:hypothetical protein CRUP_022030 [Coryphaenoides rupestris]|nr:hypothetical protein CRUP_022030 [Coryphaenoides rupestris]
MKLGRHGVGPRSQYSQGKEGCRNPPDRIPPLIATNLDTSPHTGQGHHQHRTTAGVTTFSALLVEDMGKLGLHVPEQRKTKTEAGAESPHAAPPASRGPAEPGAASAQAHLRGESMQSYGTAPGQLPSWACGPLLDSSVRSLNDGAFLSEVELQSQVCEFCHAIFPGNTATVGEFLRHLHMHIT